MSDLYLVTVLNAFKSTPYATINACCLSETSPDRIKSEGNQLGQRYKAPRPEFIPFATINTLTFTYPRMVWTLVATVFDAITGNASSTTATPPGNSADLSPSKVGSTEAEHNGELEDVFGAFSALTLSDKGKIAKTGVLERPKCV